MKSENTIPASSLPLLRFTGHLDDEITLYRHLHPEVTDDTVIRALEALIVAYANRDPDQKRGDNGA